MAAVFVCLDPLSDISRICVEMHIYNSHAIKVEIYAYYGIIMKSFLTEDTEMEDKKWVKRRNILVRRTHW